MTLISKLAISLFISVTSIFVLHKPPAPTPAETKPAPITVWQGLEPASPLPTTTVVTTPITQPDACQTVFDMARHVGWPEHELSMVVSVAYRESRCQVDAFNAKDPNGGSAVQCKSTTFGANRHGITPTAICRHTALYAHATTYLT
jgi:hypothetical protein